MAEVTEQDRAKARELVAARVKMIWSNAFSLGTANEQAEEIERIERALAAAREQATSDAYSLISQAVHARGVLDCTDFERGPVVRRVLGTLPVTADGCVVSVHQWVYVPGHAGKFGLSPNLTVPYAVRDDAGQWRDLRVDECYSTRAAAESARPTP